MFKSNKTEFKKYIDNEITKSYIEVGKAVVDAVKDETPVVSGILKDSISSNLDENENLVIYSDVDYAPYVELGTYKMYANPFMRRGIYNSISKVKDIIKKNLEV